MADEQTPNMKSVKEDLDRILEAVSDDSLSLDEALDYYEKAVKLGMKATELMEAGLTDASNEGEVIGESAPDQGGE